MKCTNCGAEIADAFAFCTSCGAAKPMTMPNASDDSDKTVLISENMDMGNQPMNNPFGQQNQPVSNTNPFTAQPQMGMAQPNQFTNQPQIGMAQPNQFANQPQMGMAQPNQFTSQPQMGMAQPNQFTNQPQMGMAQPNQFTNQPQGMYNQAPYGQPNGMYNQPPKAPRKPLSPGAKKGIIAGVIVAALAIVFFVVILPILTRSKFDGEYTDSNSYYYNKLVVDDGTYAYYDEDGNLIEAGTYTIKGETVTFVSLSGDEEKATFNADDNKIRISGDVYKSSDKKADLDIKLTESYVDDLEERIRTETDEILKDEEIYEEFEWSWYFIYEDDLKNPTTLYEEALAEALDYKNDTTLQQLVESGVITMDIYMLSDEVCIYIDAY